MSFITWIFLVMPVPSAVYSNALMTFLLQIFRSYEKNLFRSLLPLILRINGESVPKILTMEMTLL